MIALKQLITTRLIFHLTLVAMLAFNLASHSNEIWPDDGWYGRCLYWFTRLMVESMLFLGSFYLIWQLFRRQKPVLCLFFGFMLSWIVFVLTITMIDISLGRDELGGIDLNNHQLVWPQMINEAYWILPKHLFFCLLIVLINFRIDYHRWFKLEITDGPEESSTTTDDIETLQTSVKLDLLLEKLPEQIRALPLRIQAQEHYVHVTTQKGSDMFLYRFGNILEELPAEYGLQVHRSYWVARNNVKGWKQDSNSISIDLFYGDCVPVSRRYEKIVISEFSKL